MRFKRESKAFLTNFIILQHRYVRLPLLATIQQQSLKYAYIHQSS